MILPFTVTLNTRRRCWQVKARSIAPLTCKCLHPSDLLKEPLMLRRHAVWRCYARQHHDKNPRNRMCSDKISTVDKCIRLTVPNDLQIQPHNFGMVPILTLLLPLKHQQDEGRVQPPRKPPGEAFGFGRPSVGWPRVWVFSDPKGI